MTAPTDLLTELAWLDRSGVIIHVNDAWTDFCRSNGGDLARCGVGASYLDVCEAAGDHQSRLVAVAIDAAIDGHLLQALTVHVPCHSPDGPRWFDLTVAPATVADEPNPHGAVVVVSVAPVATGPSAPAERTTDGELPAALGDPWELIEEAPDGLVVVDPHGRIAYVNRQLEVLTGARRHDLLGRRLTVLIPESVRDRHHAWEESYRTAPRHRPMGDGRPLSIRRSDGSEVAAEISLAPVLIGSTVMTAASVRDVTHQRTADAARRQLLHLLDLDPDAVYIVDATTMHIEYANTGAVDLLGYPRSELASMSLSDITPSVSEEVRRSFVDEHHRLGPGHRHEIEVTRLAKNGTEIPCRSRWQLVATEAGTEKFVIVDRDDRSRLGDEQRTRRRDDVSRLVTRVTTMVLADAPEAEVHRVAVDGIAAALDSENASLVLLGPDGTPVTAAAFGPAARLHRAGVTALPPEIVSAWADRDEAFVIDRPPEEVPEAIRSQVGPGVIARFPGAGPSGGIITAFRAPDRPAFEAADVALLGDFAREVATVLALGSARTDQRRLAVLEDRQRIARDLHDLVIQDLLSIGMRIQMMPESAPLPDREVLVDDLEAAVRSLRTIVFETSGETAPDGVSAAIRTIAARAERVLGHRVDLTLSGPLDRLDDDVSGHLLAVLREGLSNVARHAQAHHTVVNVTVAGARATIVVQDDGIGSTSSDRSGSGLGNLSERAHRLGGYASLTPAPSGGSTLIWSVPVTT